MIESTKARLRTLVDSEYYTEGPAIDSEGNIYYTTLTGGRIMKLGASGEPTLWAETPRPNGQRILSNGDHLVCESKLGKVIRFDSLGNKISEIPALKNDPDFMSTPNDLAVDESAGIFVTSSVRHTGTVHFFGWDGSSRLLASDLDYPNGICLSRDKSRLYVAESYKNRIVVFSLNVPEMSIGELEVFCDLPRNERDSLTGNLPDGILVDSRDRLWVAHYGMQAVHVISPDGRLEASFDTGIPLTSNLCLTENEKDLVITGGFGEPGPGAVHILTLREEEE
jgi:gluconolactonase